MAGRSEVVPLTEFQMALAVKLSANRTEDSYLAGGAATLIEPNTKRYSNDLDYFHDSEQRVADAFATDRPLLEDGGYSVSVEMNQPGYIRAVVRKDGEATKVEWAHDSSWRFMPTVHHEQFGYVLHPIDLAVNKVLTLAGRDETRDLLDTLEAHHGVLPLGPLCWAACGKDPGFTPLSLLGLLRRRGRVRPEDLSRLRLTKPVDVVDTKEQWLDALESVEPFVASRPAEEMGCLYYSAPRGGFVDPTDIADAVPHFGRPGGVLPRIRPT